MPTAFLFKVLFESWIAFRIEVITHGKHLLYGSESEVGELTELGCVLIHKLFEDFNLSNQWTILLNVRLVQ